MKIVIFAGGVGTRLWPLSRKSTPKQFEKVVGEKSMLQVSVSKLFPDFTWEDIFISTNAQYEEILKEQFPQIPEGNIILEPEMKDVGPAVGLVMAHFIKKYPTEQVAILWGDHLVRNEEVFRRALKVAEGLIEQNPSQIVFVGQKPRFASQNLGYIEFDGEASEVDGIPVHSFVGFRYRPQLSLAEKFVSSGHHAWNLGYFVTSPKFLWGLFEKFAPDLFVSLQKISDALDTPEYSQVLNNIYPKLEKISFDNAILEKLDPDYGKVLSVDIGWSDIGAWEALKEALAGEEKENVTRGKISIEDCEDSLVFNYTNQMVVGIDLKGMLVVNMGDVLLVCPKTSVPKIKKFVESLADGPNKDLT